MFTRLMDWYVDRLVAKEHASLPAIDWRSLAGKINEEIEECSVFVETRDKRFVPVNPQDPNSKELDAVSLIVTWSHHGVKPWETEKPAKDLAEDLSERGDVSAVVLWSRSLDSFVGYYVQIRPKVS